MAFENSGLLKYRDILQEFYSEFSESIKSQEIRESLS
jgi:hypothetical protein